MGDLVMQTTMRNVMTLRVEAIYQDGEFRPLTPVGLTESQQGTLLISESATGPSRLDHELFPRKILGSLEGDVIASLEDR